MRDIVTKWGTTRNNLYSTAPAKLASNTTINGSDVNTAGYNGCIFYLIPIAYTDGTYTFTVQEAPDNGSGSPGSYTAVAAADLVSWTATSATNFQPVPLGFSLPAVWSSAATFLFQRIGYIGSKQWVRMSVASLSTSTGASFEVISELGEARLMPAFV
jgi:hypothetical protein